MEIKENFSLKELNTFGLDTYAKYFVEVSSEDEMLEVLNNRTFIQNEKFILGGGSNVLFKNDFNGIVIHPINENIEIIEETDVNVLISSSAGVNWNNFVQYCVNKNFGGIENLSLIPGNVGAAPIQNIGAYGQELQDVFYSLDGIFIEDGSKATFYKEECKFGYRNSIFKNELKNKIIITDVQLRLIKNPELNLTYGTVKEELEKRNYDSITVKEVSEVICDIRKSKLPDPNIIGNAGSFFKNPVITLEKFKKLNSNYSDIVAFPLKNDLVKIAAGWLIEKAGLKGIKFGNVGTHTKQSLVIVNYGNATGTEIVNFEKMIKEKIKEKFDIVLEEEVNIV